MKDIDTMEKIDMILMDKNLNAISRIYLIARELRAIQNIDSRLWYAILDLKDQNLDNIQFNKKKKPEHSAAVKAKKPADVSAGNKNDQTEKKDVQALASIQRVDEIIPIKGAFKVEIAKSCGRQFVVEKGEFKPGDDAVFIKPGSFVPADGFEFLSNFTRLKRDRYGLGFPIKKRRMFDYSSEGLLMNVKIVADAGWVGLPLETDVTGVLDVRAWKK